jgi:hypothetical protein
MKKLLLLSMLLCGFMAQASTMYEEAYPDLNNDNLRDKIEITKEDDGSASLNFYLAKAKYEYNLVSSARFNVREAYELPHMAIDEKRQIIIEQTVATGDTTTVITSTFEFRKDDLHLLQKALTVISFDDRTVTTTNYVKGEVTVQKIKNYSDIGPKKLLKKIKKGAPALGELANLSGL